MGPMIINFITCNFGEHLTVEFLSVADKYYEVSWYDLPRNMQRMWPIIISGGQNEIGLKGFGSMCLDRELYLKVFPINNLCVYSIQTRSYFISSMIKAAFSYFMVLREFM